MVYVWNIQSDVVVFTQVNASWSCNAIISGTNVLELLSVGADIIVTPHVGHTFFKRLLWGNMVLLSHFGSFLRIRMTMTKEPWRSVLLSTLKSRRPTRYGGIFCFFGASCCCCLFSVTTLLLYRKICLLFFELNARKGKDRLCVGVWQTGSCEIII